ncbi:MAG: hypothetical protein K0S94_72, partial [Nitrospira sp.]|nr:hypothetical protein [Nitrospira sp.]
CAEDRDDIGGLFFQHGQAFLTVATCAVPPTQRTPLGCQQPAGRLQRSVWLQHDFSNPMIKCIRHEEMVLLVHHEAERVIETGL